MPSGPVRLKQSVFMRLSCQATTPGRAAMATTGRGPRHVVGRHERRAHRPRLVYGAQRLQPGGPHMIAALLAAGAAASFTLTSPDLPKGKPIANKHVFNSFGCSGENVSPALEWKGAPSKAKGFALTAYDPDAPT